jgi:hypothetical protein
MNRCDDKILIRFQQVHLCMLAMPGGSPNGLFALVRNLVSQIGRRFAPVSGMLANEYGGLACRERDRGGAKLPS